MDSGRICLQWRLPLLLLLLLLVQFMCAVRANLVFDVHHKYGGSRKEKVSLRELRAHDSRRHGRNLAAVDFQLGGDGSPTSVALYYAKITIGSPPVDYHVQIDTGSDIMWLNCKGCDSCPTKSDLKIDLKQYDMSASSTGKVVSCDQPFCATVFLNHELNCKAGQKCEYSVTYGDGSKAEGYFVRDSFTFDQVTGNQQTSAMNGSIAFGCSMKQTGDTSSSSQAVDGIIGLGQANTSVLSQLASAGKVKKIFSHCLDSKKGGGIFAIGEVAEPKFNSTGLVPNEAHYNAILSSIEVDDTKLKLPWDFFGLSHSKKIIIDSGTTLAYLRSDIYKQIMDQVLSHQPNLKLYVMEEQFKCFSFSGNVDDGFPVVKFIFEDSLTLPVYPHNYLFELDDEEYCFGWQNSGEQAKDSEEVTLLGDLALSDKLVVYDLEKQTVGWTSHDCSTGIKVKDDASGNAYDVTAKSLSSDSPLLQADAASILLFVATAFLYLIS